VGAQLGTGEGANADLNLTPLIDIVLVVLIIMMVNMPIQIEEMGLKLPNFENVNPPPPDPNAEQLVVAAYADGRLALNRRLMTQDNLFYEVTRRLRGMDKKNVFVDADSTLPYGKVVDLIDLAREAGAVQVGIAKAKEGGPLEPTSVAEGSMPRGVTVGSPKVVGAITEKKADNALQAILPSINGCYAAALGAQPGLSGRLLVKTTIGPAGEHLEPPVIDVGSTIDDPALRGCIEALLPTIAYEPLGEGNTAVALYPLLFSPG
jgi:biopolymer transport protein ExbD